MTSGKEAQQSSLNSNFLWGLDMRRHSIVLLAGAVGLLAVGCGTSTEEGATDTAASPSPSAVATTTAQQPFGTPLVTEKTTGKDAKTKDGKAGAAKKATKVPGLLQSTDPDERAKRVQATIRGRAGVDPFASLPDDRDRLIFSSPVISAAGGGSGAGGGIGPISGSGGGGRPPLSDIGGGSSGGGLSGGGGTIALGPSNVPSIPAFPEATEVRPIVKRPLIARGPVGTSNLGPGPNGGLTPLPAIPEPNLAKAVEVTGVITVGGITQAIVKAPNEPTSRHVIVGQRLSNGQVLVKRIESNSGSDPIVILEENGVEVARAVGDKPAAGPGTPTAMLLIQRIFG
jgi:hypothetical protein